MGWMRLVGLLLWLQVMVEGKEFQPYADNSGTIVGLAGRDYCIMAADTRLSDSYFIRSRGIRRIHVLDDEVDDGSLLLGASGCWADSLGLAQGVREDITRYRWENGRRLSIRGLAHLLSTTLYSRRSFPYYSLCVAAGLDDESRQGSVYRFDSVGSFERVCATCAGKGEQLIQPMLDEATQMEQSSELWALDPEGDAFDRGAPGLYSHLSLDAACELIVKAFTAAAEREITIGDGVDIIIVSYDGEASSDGRKRQRRRTRRYCFLKHT